MQLMLIPMGLIPDWKFTWNWLKSEQLQLICGYRTAWKMAPNLNNRRPKTKSERKAQRKNRRKGGEGGRRRRRRKTKRNKLDRHTDTTTRTNINSNRKKQKKQKNASKRHRLSCLRSLQDSRWFYEPNFGLKRLLRNDKKKPNWSRCEALTHLHIDCILTILARILSATVAIAEGSRMSGRHLWTFYF